MRNGSLREVHMECAKYEDKVEISVTEGGSCQDPPAGQLHGIGEFTKGKRPRQRSGQNTDFHAGHSGSSNQGDRPCQTASKQETMDAIHLAVSLLMCNFHASGDSGGE